MDATVCYCMRINAGNRDDLIEGGLADVHDADKRRFLTRKNRDRVTRWDCDATEQHNLGWDQDSWQCYPVGAGSGTASHFITLNSAIGVLLRAAATLMCDVSALFCRDVSA